MPGDQDHGFFTGIIQGALGRPSVLYNGGLRSAQNLGFGASEDAQSAIVFHNHLTRQAFRYGLNSIITHHPDPTVLPGIWAQLPPQTRSHIRDRSLHLGGQMVGATAVNMGVSMALTRGLRMPRQIVAPAMLVVGVQGMMAMLWRDVVSS